MNRFAGTRPRFGEEHAGAWQVAALPSLGLRNTRSYEIIPQQVSTQADKDDGHAHAAQHPVDARMLQAQEKQITAPAQ